MGFLNKEIGILKPYLRPLRYLEAKNLIKRKKTLTYVFLKLVSKFTFSSQSISSKSFYFEKLGKIL